MYCGLSAPSGNIVHYDKPRTYMIGIRVERGDKPKEKEKNIIYLSTHV